MPYATPTHFIAKFGLAETVQLLADEEQLLTAELLLGSIAGAWTGASSAAEQAAATAALARLVTELQVASNFMDGYLRAVVTLPLAEDDANAGTLQTCCLALARVGLADDPDNATERMDKAAETWRAWLKDIAARRVQLVTPAGDTPTGTASVRAGQAKSGFCWGVHGGLPR